MDPSSSFETGTLVHQNQPYDESLEVPDSEEVASQYTPSPRNTEDLKKMDTPEDLRGSDSLTRGPPPDTDAMRSGTGDDEDDEEDDDDEEDSDAALPEGGYDPSEFENLPVDEEIKELFQYISRYTPQKIDMDYKLKPFIPDLIPAVGDLDAFIKVPRPDNKPDALGLTVLDEPSSQQSDPTVLDLMLRAQSKQSSSKQVTVNSIPNAEKNPEAVDSWIANIEKLHKMKPLQSVHYSKNMPDIDNLMQEWPADFEELLKDINLPSAELDCSLDQYIDLICSLLDIPNHGSRVQSLHVLFTLFSEFKNSQHFKALADDNKLDNNLKGGGGGGSGVDRFEL